jgi:polyphosphate kinase 2
MQKSAIAKTAETTVRLAEVSNGPAESSIPPLVPNEQAPSATKPRHPAPARLRRDPDAIRRAFETGEFPYQTRLGNKQYEAEMAALQIELLKAQSWVKQAGEKIILIFEGRDAAGKGGTIKRFMEHLNPRGARVIALEKPTERERTQWYFQRYIEQLPAAGEVVLFDRSWYNRAGIEKVLGFCTPEEHRQFLRQCPIFERQLIEDGIRMIKYWFSVSDEEQERRFRARVDDPMKRWKLSETDLMSRTRYVDYSRAKDEMFVHTDIPESPWFVVEADDKRRARINCIAHLLSKIPYEVSMPERIEIPSRQRDDGYVRPPKETYTYVPDRAADLLAQAG